jgi:tetratricopeptide (TPR) repeat protein
MQEQLKVELGFVQRRLPWIIAGVAFVVYLATLNHAATYSGLVNLARVVGWDWRPTLSAPLQVLVTYPVRFLPAGLQLAALNVIAAACAAAALGFLARCVALLPHDRTRDQRQLERSEHSFLSGRWAWVPPVLAALVCGLQLSFWENAVVGTGEALDLLVFAWLVQALLLFRLDQKESRLNWFAFIYGLGITNNHGLIGFFPFFVGALIWIRGMAFFNVRCLLRMALLGLAGLLLYFLLPTLALGSETTYSWWTMVKSYWAAQRDNLIYFPRLIALLLGLTSILPVVFMGIRWPAQFGEVSPLGNALTNVMTHLIHLVFLAACTYVAFDQFYSPRSLGGNLAAFLPFYFLGALSIGYCAGYFLLLGGKPPANLPQWQKPSGLGHLTARALSAVILVGLIVIPGLLVYQNLPRILADTGGALSRISRLAAQSLPAEGAIVLSDEKFRLYALEHELRQTGGREKYVLIDTRSLESGSYHLHLLKRHPNLWPSEASTVKPTDRVPQPNLVKLLLTLSQKLPIYYLHPSFGYYFESFEMRPRGLVYHLRPFTTATISGAPLTAQEIAEGAKFWEEVRQKDFPAIIPKIPPAEFLSAGAKTRQRPATLEMYVGRAYALALNYFGVAVQQAGDMAKAAEYYDLALKLDPYNASALLNGEYNKQFRAGKIEGIKPTEDVMKRFGMAGGSWEGVLAYFGPLEEPASTFALGLAFAAGNNPRQASQMIERVIHYNPENLRARVVQLNLLVRAGLPDIALERIAALRSSSRAAQLSSAEAIEVSVAEAWALAAKNNLARAVEILRAQQAQHPTENLVWTSLFDIYRSVGQFTNALTVVEEQLKAQPRNVQALVNAAVLNGGLGQPKTALEYYNRALEVNPKDESALLNRAMLYSQLNDLDRAQADFETLHVGKSNSPIQVELGLADVYYRKKNFKDATRLYRELLKKLPEGSPDHQLVQKRLQEID